MAGLDLLLLLACALDLAGTPAPARAALERRVPERVGLSRAFERTLALTLPRARGLAFTLHEEVPEAFALVRAAGEGEQAEGAEPRTREDEDARSGTPDAGRFDAEGRALVRRVYRSPRRGVFRLGDVRLRVVGPLGLVARQARLSGAQEVAVEPALSSLRRTLALASSERWRDAAARRSAVRGGRAEFESLREYVPGDDVRRVDWKAFARRGKPIVRDYEVERGQELVLLVDRGRRMRAATAGGRHRGWSKLDWALDAALELAAVALAEGDRVGAGAFAGELAPFVAPARGAAQLARLSRALFALEPLAEEGELGHALRALAARHRRRATVVVLSDVADPLSVEEQRRALAQAARRHRVVFAALDDPDVRALAAGRRASALERAGALSLAADRRAALRRLASSGARVLDALPAETAGPLLAAWLDERRR